MALEQRIESLRKRHAQIDALIQAEAARAALDTEQIHRWKIEKLSLKDEIARLEEETGGRLGRKQEAA